MPKRKTTQNKKRKNRKAELQDIHNEVMDSVIMDELNTIQAVYAKDNDSRKHINNCYKLILRCSNQNETLKKLCKKLQSDKKLLTENVNEIETREKEWRREIEGKFESSLADIRDKIGVHEDRYNNVVSENKKLTKQLETFIQYDTKRSADFELYKTHQLKLDEIHGAEKENFTAMIEKEKEQTVKLSHNLRQAIEINDLLKQKCNQYESKFNQMAKTVKESSKCIDEYKKMNIELMKQNKSLHSKLQDIMGKYKQLNSYNDTYKKKNDTLSQLCRKLQMKNKELSMKQNHTNKNTSDVPQNNNNHNSEAKTQNSSENSPNETETNIIHDETNNEIKKDTENATVITKTGNETHNAAGNNKTDQGATTF